MACADGCGGDCDYGGDLGHDRGRARPGDPTDHRKLTTSRRETSGDGRGWSPRGHAEAAGACAGASEAARCDRAGRARAGASEAAGCTGACRDRAGRARASGRRTASDGCATTEGGTASARTHPGGRDPTAATQRRAEHRSLQLADQPHRKNQRERGPLPAHLVLERCAGRAAIDMGARHAARQDLAVDRCQQLADLRARTIPSLAAAHERLPRLEDERFDLLAANAQHRSDLTVRLVTELKKNQCRALIVRQPLDLLQQLVEFLLPLDLVCWPISA